ncbi:LOW QUALITY PROTEIN: hypothetical protein Cgig2_007717 [Carnegiea gigantea]|uniref:R13L1/DRL21-like LRR repeat region domain-containing protein n=1 Tax=Carnegiea gigantea TaxID=171969 RepID=A0A9Q1K9N1_9CARY|nr:LOW QUALITY PROTEIN: hypothetical protein Cgig2_007717 [Carnegiea gigantea]
MPMFVASDRTSTLKSSIVDQMEDLKALINLKEYLEIKILKNDKHARENISEGGCIWNKEHLNSWGSVESTEIVDCEEGLLENLQPHCNLRELKFYRYRECRVGQGKITCIATFLPNLVRTNLLLSSWTAISDIVREVALSEIPRVKELEPPQESLWRLTSLKQVEILKCFDSLNERCRHHMIED